MASNEERSQIISTPELNLVAHPVGLPIQGFPILAKSGSAEGGSPLPGNGVSPSFFSLPAAGGKNGELESPGSQFFLLAGGSIHFV
jgi:hypothetical protein